MLDSITQYDITWTFSQKMSCGQFCNLDWWVVGPVTITNINPKTGDDGITFSHGSMLNPIPGQTQGLYNNGPVNNPENQPAYDAGKNISLQLPYTVAKGNSVYSTVNNPDTWLCIKDQSGNCADPWTLDLVNAEKVWFKETAVLTVLSAIPFADSFRPAYAGTDKTVRWNKANIDYTKLSSLAIPNINNAPSLNWLVEATKRPLMEMNFNYVNSNWKASWKSFKPGGYPRRAYGREVAGIAGASGLMLNTNLTNAQKERLAIQMVQWGIDTYYLLENGMNYQSNGGHNLGRLFPVFLAGKLLNEPLIIAAASGASPFQEIYNHFYVNQEIIDIPRAPHSPPHLDYTQDMIGMPEWCMYYPNNPDNSAAWNNAPTYYSSLYRFTNGGPNCSVIAAILIMGGRSSVNYEPLFRYYIDRYYPREKPDGDGPFVGDQNGIEYFTRDMWDAYVHPQFPPSGNWPFIQ